MNVLQVMYDHASRWGNESDIKYMVSDVERYGCKVLAVVPDTKIPHIVERNSCGYCVFMVVDNYPDQIKLDQYSVSIFDETVNTFYCFDHYGLVMDTINKIVEPNIGITSNFVTPQPNNILFLCGDKEMIRLEPNGDIYVKEKLVTNDMEVVDGLREFVKCLGSII